MATNTLSKPIILGSPTTLATRLLSDNQEKPSICVIYTDLDQEEIKHLQATCTAIDIPQDAVRPRKTMDDVLSFDIEEFEYSVIVTTPFDADVFKEIVETARSNTSPCFIFDDNFLGKDVSVSLTSLCKVDTVENHKKEPPIWQRGLYQGRVPKKRS